MTGAPFHFITDGESGDRHAMPCAQLIAIGVAKAGAIQVTGAASTDARRRLDCHAVVRDPAFLPDGRVSP